MFIALTKIEGGSAQRMLDRAGLNARIVRNAIRQEIGTGDGSLDQVLPLTPRALMVLSLAIFLAERDDADDVTEDHIVLAILQEGESVPVRKLIEMGFNVNLWLQRMLSEAFHLDPDSAGEGGEESEALFHFSDADDPLDFPDDDYVTTGEARERVHTGRLGNPTPLLDKYGRDLTTQAKEGKISAAIAREREIRAVARTLARSKKNNPLLLGDAGVGKTAVVEGLAYAITHRTAPAALLDKRIVQIEIGALVAGTSLRGQFEERLMGIIEEASRAGNIILFIDEIHTIVGAGDTIDSNLDAANILKPALARGEMVCIGATTHAEYRRAIAQDPALDRRFRPIDIEEPNEQDTLAILTAQRERLEKHHQVAIHPDAIEAAVRLSIRYMPDRRLPDKALDLLDEACARERIGGHSGDGQDDDTPSGGSVGLHHITAVLSEWTGIPVSQLDHDEKRRLSEIVPALLSRVIGQDDAVTSVASAIKMARAGLSDPSRPIGVFLFLGPSGVGKTELARALAHFLFGSEDALLRLDMSEFHDAHTVSRLIGSPPGYRESNRGGQLTDGLRRRPYSVVLLDEVEKAAPEVFDIFLQVFDEGRLSDAHGGRVDARHAVFIMTSNIGTEEGSRTAFGFDRALRSPDYHGHLVRFFRPEFVNRIDEVVIFRPLSPQALERILELQLTDLRARLASQRLQLDLLPDARALILARGHDPVNGARPLRRAIERLLTRPLSARIVEDAFPPGSVIRVSADGDALRFDVPASSLAI
jgi:ATP-dependent Clp protease ATP-binding subunit ClpC